MSKDKKNGNSEIDVGSPRVIPFRAYTHFSRPPVPSGEVILGKSQTTILGYVDHADLIRQMVEAGEVLAAIRALQSGGHYDAPPDADPNEIKVPESRKKDFDLVELGLLHKNVLDVLKEIKDNSDNKNDAPSDSDTVQVEPPKESIDVEATS